MPTLLEGTKTVVGNGILYFFHHSHYFHYYHYYHYHYYYYHYYSSTYVLPPHYTQECTYTTGM